MTTTWNSLNNMTTSWTDIPKPVAETSSSIVAGEPIGLLLALTYAEGSSFTSNIWTDVPKAT